MPCFSPLQSFSQLREDGKKSVRFAKLDFFTRGVSLPGDFQLLPCGKCVGCRLEKSRQVALRAVHESRMHDDACFITLTFDDKHLEKMCPLTPGGYSLVRKHVQKFMKRLREKFSRGFFWVDSYGDEEFYKADGIRALGCGEYGDLNSRPHYHFCLFGCSFPDRSYWNTVDGFKYYNSDVLSSLWKFGHAVIGDFSFETAAYVARYCTKKINGEKAKEHYRGRLPEFSVMPSGKKGGLGKPFFDRYARCDIFPTDTCVARGHQCKVPRYYDKLWEKADPVGFAAAKEKRKLRAEESADDNTYRRLQDKEKCMNARMRNLSREISSL